MNEGMTIEQRLQIDSFWWTYDIFDTYHAAFEMLGFAKNQGYAAAKIRDRGDGKFEVAVIQMKVRKEKSNG